MPLIVFSVATLAGLLLRHVLLRVLVRRNAPVAIVDALRVPTVLWCIAAALAVAIHGAQLPPVIQSRVHKSIGAFVILSIGLVAAAIGVRAIAMYGERHRLPFAVAGLSRTLVYIVVFSITLPTLLSLFEVRITPILTALGVGGLAVALALQDTLANFFAGIHILVEEPLTVGDYIELADNQKGTVVDIGWRTTRILTGANTVLVIPNQKITSGILTNHSLPQPRVTAEIAIYAAHSADPNRLAAIALDAAGATEGVLNQPEPVVAFDPGVLATHLQLKLIVHAKDVEARGRAQSEIRKRIYEGMVNEGLPFPEVKPSI